MNVATRASIAQGLVVMAVNPLRTALSTLGVVIGIASVIATLALTDGLEQYAREQIAAQTDLQSVTVTSRTEEVRDGFSYPNRSFPVFGMGDAAELRRFLGGAIEVTMMVGGRTVVTSPTAPPHIASVTACLANLLQYGRKDVHAGRFFTDGEAARNAPVVVLSYKLAQEMSPDGDALKMLEREVRVRGRALTVVGVMPSFLGESSYQMFVPLRAAAMLLGGGVLTPQMLARAPTLESTEATKAAVIEWLATRYRDWNREVSVTTSLAHLTEVRRAMLLLKVIFGALAGISLVVGGVGIMNVLLASVAERTREIGVRKALGARQRDILYQFLAESVAIAGVGSGIGTVIGLTAAFAVTALVRWQIPGAQMRAAVTPATLMTAIISAVVIGLTFGTFPAVRAARLSPIDAIRHD